MATIRPPADPNSSRASEEIEADFFNRFIEENKSFDPFTERGWQAIGQHFARLTAGQAQLDIVDVGCGSGASRRLYINQAGSYTGIDLSIVAIEYARKRYPENQWLVANALQLPLADNSVDVVAFSSVLHHIPDFGLAVREAMRVLKPGGKIFAFDPNVFHPALGLLRHPSSPLYLSKGVSPNEKPLAPSALREAFNQAGVTEIFQRCQSGIHYRYVDVGICNTFLKVYNVLDSCLEFSLLGRWMGAFIITTGIKPIPNPASAS